MTKPPARSASAIVALASFAWPARAVEPVRSEQTVEGLLADGYRLAGATTMQDVSLPLPFLFLAKEGVPAIYHVPTAISELRPTGRPREQPATARQAPHSRL